MGRTFLSTPSARRATRTGKPRPTAPQLFLSTPSARRATGARFSISTSSVNFYPRPPRGGRRRRWRSRKHQSRFLSTPSARRATKLGRAMLRSSRRFLSTPSARRATKVPRYRPFFTVISIHALREEGDRHTPRCFVHKVISIHALREEGDSTSRSEAERRDISIHALREEGDTRSSSTP